MFIRLLATHLILALAVASSCEAAEKGVALVIGNATYAKASPLRNPQNDAQDMAIALRKLGFTVILGIDLDKARMDQKIRQFGHELESVDVGVFFYSGHGLQVGGTNYLVPVDAELATEFALDFEAVRLDLVQRIMERETKTNILFLDACRSNPFTRNLARSLGMRGTDIGRGFAPVESGIGTLISFSTQPGNVALDGTGRNSPYSEALVKKIMVPGEDILSVLTSVRNEVLALTNEKQVPWENHALRAKFYFNSATPEPAPHNTEMPEPAPQKTKKEAFTQLSIAAKSGETVDLRQVYGAKHCKSILVAPPEVEVLQGPPELKLSVRQDMVTPQNCQNKVKGGFVVATVGDVKQPTEGKLTFRVKYKTKDGTHLSGYVYNVSLFPK